MRTFRTALFMVAGLLAVAPSRVDAQKRSRDLIKRDEIVANIREDQDLFTAIQRLRPHFLESPGRSMQGMGTFHAVRIYIDRNEQSGVDFLKSVLAWDVEEVRYLSPSDAAGRFGDRANGGAIVLKMLKVKQATTTPPKIPPA
jgi:hypothetical protein